MMSSYAGVARLASLPDVPTMREIGGADETMAPGYFTFVAAAGTPREIIHKLQDEMGGALAAPDLQERLAVAGMEPHITSPEAFAAGVRADIARFARLVKSLGIETQ